MTKKILIACDGSGLGVSVKSILEKKGHKVHVTTSAKEFIGKLKNENYDLGLINFFLPEMSGRELAEKARKAKIKELKFIFMNVAHFGAKGKEELRRLGVSAYVHRVDSSNFMRLIKQIA